MGRFLDWLLGPVPADTGPTLTADMTPAEAALVAAVALRSEATTVTRTEALKHSVVNRARDLLCGTLARLPFDRERARAGVVERLGPGWLDRPDPDHTRGWFVSWVTDDLFFHAAAYVRVTVRDAAGFPLAVQRMPYAEVVDFGGPDGVLWSNGGTLVDVPERDLIRFESPLLPLLGAGPVLSTAIKLDRAADRFATYEIPAGHLKQVTGEPMSADELAVLAAQFAEARAERAIGALNTDVEWNESTLDPSRLQLIEGRSYSDVAVARIANVPAWSVNAAVPGDSMTYKTALTARWDLLDFGLAPFIAAWEQTLSLPTVTPSGTTVRMVLDDFLRTAELAGVDTAPAPTAPGGTP